MTAIFLAESSPMDEAVRSSVTIDYETKAFTYGLVDADDPVGGALASQ